MNLVVLEVVCRAITLPQHLELSNHGSLICIAHQIDGFAFPRPLHAAVGRLTLAGAAAAAGWQSPCHMLGFHHSWCSAVHKSLSLNFNSRWIERPLDRFLQWIYVPDILNAMLCCPLHIHITRCCKQGIVHSSSSSFAKSLSSST